MKVTKQGGGTYDAYEVVYRNTNNEIKQLTKPAGGLKYTKGLKGALETLAPGDAFTIIQEKEGDFWNVKGVEKGHSDVPYAPKQDGNREMQRVASGGTGSRVTGSTYETPIERAKKQVLIIRQSSVGAAVEHLGTKATIEDVLVEAGKIEEFIWKDFEEKAKTYLTSTLTESE